MARKTFFSFHYKPDVSRAQIVRNSWMTKSNREEAGFFDSSVFEASQRTSPDSLKRFLIEGLYNTSVTCVLVGEETYMRPWVRFELFRSFHRGNGLLAINISGLTHFGKKSIQGPNPFNHLAFTVTGDNVSWKEKIGEAWPAYTEVPTMKLSEVAYNLGGLDNHTFSHLFPIYDWVNNDGYNNLGSWVENAAKQAGR
jgi:hypothetical protein